MSKYRIPMTMNRAAMRAERENQKRLQKELERLSTDQPAHLPALATHSHVQDLSELTLDLLSDTESQLSYPTDCPLSEPVQVDHNGTKVPEITAFVPFFGVHDAPNAVTISTSTTDSFVDKTIAVIPSYVSSMLVADEPIPKRLRAMSPVESTHRNAQKQPSDVEEAGEKVYVNGKDDPSSPRSVSAFPKQFPDSMDAKLAPTPTASIVKVHPTGAVVEYARKIVTVQFDAARDPAACKKRRAEAMERFRRKKAVRCYGRKVRYQIRKRIATSRPRVNGRFARRCDAEVQQAAKKAKG